MVIKGKKREEMAQVSRRKRRFVKKYTFNNNGGTQFKWSLANRNWNIGCILGA